MGRPTPKRKFVKLHGKRKQFACRCPKCGNDKTLEARKSGDKWVVSGVSEVQKTETTS